jgi:hypothetical protein
MAPIRLNALSFLNSFYVCMASSQVLSNRTKKKHGCCSWSSVNKAPAHDTSPRATDQAITHPERLLRTSSLLMPVLPTYSNSNPPSCTHFSLEEPPNNALPRTTGVHSINKGILCPTTPVLSSIYCVYTLCILQVFVKLRAYITRGHYTLYIGR